MVCGGVFLVEEVEVAFGSDLEEGFVADESLGVGVPPRVVSVKVSGKDGSFG
jgi:hypothetical protein